MTDRSGKTLKEINLSGTGKGVLNLDASTFSSGVHNYSLYIISRLLDTKGMVFYK